MITRNLILQITEPQKDLLQNMLHDAEYNLKRYAEKLGSQENFELKKEVDEILADIDALLFKVGRDNTWEKFKLPDYDHEMAMKSLRDVKQLLEGLSND